MNSNLINYLEYYLTLEIEPKYAVMINGEWGSGKSWFIDNLSKRSSLVNTIFFKISLYGITTSSQIDDEIYKLLHPVLSGKSMMFAGAVAKALLKGTIKLDLNGDGKEDGAAQIQLPELKIKDFTKHPQKIVLIFDDLERCNIGWNEVFGYINTFVEKYGCKVILIANESAIVVQNDSTSENDPKSKLPNDYLVAKEKVVSKTIFFKPDLSSAYSNFISEIKNKKLILFLIEQRSLVSDIFILSECHNLRFLRVSLLEFERLYWFLNKLHYNDYVLNKELLKRIIIFCIEYRLNKITITELAGKDSVLSESQTGKLTEKYNIPIFSSPILSCECWDSLIVEASPDEVLIKKDITHYLALREVREESWVTLWYHHKISTEEFDEAFEKTVTNLKKKVYTNEFIIKHLFGIFLALDEKNALKVELQNLLDLCLSAIADLGESGLIVPFNDEIHTSTYIYEAWGGLGYQKNEDKRFKEFIKFIEEKRHFYELLGFYNVNKQICETISNTGSDLSIYCILNPNARGIKSYYDKPILHYALTRDYVDAILKCNDLNNLGASIKARYTTNGKMRNIIDERFFLDELIELLTINLNYVTHPLQRSRIDELINNYLKPALKFIYGYRFNK